MVLGVPGIGPVDETGAVKPAGSREPKSRAGGVINSDRQDAVAISPAGRVAARAAGEDGSAVRLDRVEEARRRIAEGQFKSRVVVEELAFRLNVYLG